MGSRITQRMDDLDSKLSWMLRSFGFLEMPVETQIDDPDRAAEAAVPPWAQRLVSNVDHIGNFFVLWS